MKQKAITLLALLLITVQYMWAWDGSGTQTDPYKIQSSADWQEFAIKVSMGNSYQGTFFKMTNDIDANGINAGTSTFAFNGTFDGGNHTLTYNRGENNAQGVQAVDDYCAPFVLLNGATIRHLRVTGTIYSKHMHAAGIASLITGANPTTIDDCHVSSHLFGTNNLSNDASFGGLVGEVLSTCSASPVIKNCSFTGSFGGWVTSSSGMVAFTSKQGITFEHCIFDPKVVPSVEGTPATYVRMAPGVVSSFKECYFTQTMGTSQGVAVFKSVEVPENCTVEIVSEPTIDFDGNKYWQNGATIRLSAPDNADFNHWETNGSCYVNDPWQRSGTLVLQDVQYKPTFSILNAMVKPTDERTMDGTKYRYLSKRDYHLYITDEMCRQRGYEFDENGNLYKKVGNSKAWITAVVGWESGKIPADGAQIHNDLSGVLHDYTLMACIAPHAFKGCTELKTLYFKDTDANNYTAQDKLHFVIGDSAFANCPNLTEIKMMQYTTEGSNHWEALKPEQVISVGRGVFGGSPQANFSTDVTEYQNYLSSETWQDYQNRIIVYNHTNVDFTVNGAKYSYMRNTKGEPLKNSNSDHTTLMETLRLWNADYQEFTASSLLATNDQKNIWYASIVGCDDSYLKSNDGTLRIYNDPGSYYNYKTIAIDRNAFKDSKELKKIEFWQTNGRSDNSFSDLKMVIQNGAFKGCTNLKELRMFYYVQDGDDHWKVLGPKDVIPGDNIFGIPSEDELEGLSVEEQDKKLKEVLPQNFKILVSPDCYQEFLEDPNWLVYIEYIEPVEFNPNGSDMKDFSLGGLTYSYMTSPGGIMQTSQTVSQDVSWWTAVRIGVELATDLAAFGSVKGVKQTLMSTSEKIAKMKDLLAVKFDDVAGWTMEVNGVATELAKTYGQKALDTGIQSYLPQLVETGAYRFLVKYNFIVNGALIIPQADNLALLKQFNRFLRSLMRAAVDVANQEWHKDVAKVIIPFSTKIPGYSMAANLAGSIATASYLSSKHWGGTGSYNGDLLQKGMKANILSNIHQVGLVGSGYVITTPQKNLCYHTYIKDVPASTTDAVIYAGTGKGQGRNNNARTMTMAKTAFRDHTNLKTVKFHETGIQSDEAMPMLFTIPDSAFVGCTNLQSFDLRVQTENNGQQALGPESFILGGDSIFAGLDPAKFHIIIDPKRKQDFLDNESWKPLERFFTYEEALPETQYQEYGGNYAYAYENGTTQKVNKVSGHKIEHTVVTGADDSFLNEHQGALKLCNDIGVWNNYQLDAVTTKAFKGNQNLRVVNFTDLKGTGAYGTCYTGLEVALMDSCFKDCKNLANLDLLYLVTDGDNHIDPIKPNQVTIGKGVFDGTTAKIKMMPQQVAWFEADTTWNKYKDRFMACIIRPADEGIHKALKPMAYYDMAHTGYDPTTWDEYIDLARIAGAGFSWLDGKFREQRDDIRSFADFQHFESVGLDYVGKEWFRGCRKMTNIVLPKTIKHIDEYAFASCSSLQEIELPAAVSEINACAFADCKDLRVVRVLGTTPAKLNGTDHFQKNEGLKIYVPDAAVEAYKAAWTEYKDYIVSDKTYTVIREVTLTEAGTLAEKLGLYVEWSYAGAAGGDEPRYIHGNYAKYDSLVVHGPLNDFDLWTIRYLSGNNGYNRGGIATDGNLRCLNLYDTRIVKDDNKAHYLNKSWGIKWQWLAVQNANELPYNLFFNCTALESLVLPKTLTKMNARIFEGCSSLKKLAIPASLQDYDTWDYLKGELDYPLEELVFVTDKVAVSERNNPWGQNINVVYTKQSQLSDYMNQPYLTRSAQNVIAPFEDDAVMEALAENGYFFPSQYTQRNNVELIFNNNEKLKRFNDFNKFTGVRTLGNNSFSGCRNLKSISLPDSLQHIHFDAFQHCTSLDTILINTDKVPVLEKYAFDDLPADFCILVPKTLCKVYREKWAEYADHINVNEQNNSGNEWTVVTLDKPNTLAEKLGFEVNWDYRSMTSDKHNYINGVRGDYSKIHKLKVNGPISGSDFAFMRYLAGFCPWSNSRNAMGQLEAIDLYDADIKASDDLAAPDMFKVITQQGDSYIHSDNELPSYAFLQAYNLKSLVLPKTCTKIYTRALQQCEALETLVLGDDLVDFNWSSLDDDAMLTRLYIMAKKKPKMDVDAWLIRQLHNNYNPTFDAFYVRPSLYNEYLSDRAYTHDLQRTSLISKGVFDDDDSFCAFARHAAATQDDLAGIADVKGWFDAHPGAKNLTPLKYTSIDSLKTATVEKLTQLECIALPKTLKDVDKNVFQKNTKMRYVDFLQCQDADLLRSLRYGAQSNLGLNEERTLVYMPAAYDNIGETNVIVDKGGQLKTEKFHLIDSLDYLVPYAFEANQIANTRKLAVSKVPHTVCLPYSMALPAGAVAYQLSKRDANKLVFEEVTSSNMEALHLYLVVVDGKQAQGQVDHITLDSYKSGAPQPVPASTGIRMEQDDVPGYSIRGTLKAISNKEAADLGAYILQSDGKWHPVTTAKTEGKILPFRSYLLPSARRGAAPIEMSLISSNGDVTGIDTIQTIDRNGNSRYYDLQGREIDGSSAKGLVIKNGKKVIIK